MRKMTREQLMMMMFVLVVASPSALVTGQIVDDRLEPSSTLALAGDRDASISVRRRREADQQGLVPDGVRSWTVRRRVSTGSDDEASSTTESRLTAEQWRRRERNKQTRLFMIQRQIMASLGLSRRPQVPHRNITDADIERLMPVLQQGDSEHNDSQSARLYVVKRVHALLPVCQTPAPPQDSTNSVDNSPMSRSGQRSGRRGSRPMTLYFDTAQLTGGVRRSLVHVKSALLRLHWTGQLPPRRRPRHRRREVSDTRRERRRPSGTRTHNSTTASALRLLVYQPTKLSTRRDGRKLVASVRLGETDDEGWVTLNIRSAVDQWINKPRRNLGLEIVVRDASRRGRRRKHDPRSVVDGYDCCATDDSSCHVTNTTTTYPTVDVIVLQRTRRRQDGVVVTNQRRRRRRQPRRRSRDRRDVTDERACTLETMHVSFAELGWLHWIVQPKHFVTGFCNGVCPTPLDSEEISNSRHELTQTSDGEGCVPTEQRPLSVVYLNQHHELVATELPNMVVTRCDCVVS